MGVRVHTRLPEKERVVVGDFSHVVIPGERCCGLTYDELKRIAETTHQVDSADLPEMP